MNEGTATDEPVDATRRPWDQLEELLDRGDGAEAGAFLESLSFSEAARCVGRLDGEHRERVLASMSADHAAELLEHLPEAQSAELLENSAPATAAAVFEEMSSDVQADVLNELNADSAESLLASCDPAVAEAARSLASYPSDTAGGLMVREYLSYRDTTTVSDIVADLRGRIDEVEDYAIQYIYVTDAELQLTGVLRLRDLLLARGQRTAQQLMIHEPLCVPATATLDELVDLFEEKSFLGIPVVAEPRTLVGIVHRSDVDEAWDERAESSRLKAQGIVGGEELRSMPLARRSRRRLSWLSVNIVLNLAAAAVIAAHQDTLEQVIVLAVFLPMISDMSGCSGNQAVAVSMRELTLGVVRPIDVLYVWRKEVQVGLINGLALGVLLGLVAYAWQGDPWLGLVVGAALSINTIVAVTIGGIVPLGLKRFGVDPALASGPILTTLTDVCGFLLALSFAAALMT